MVQLHENVSFLDYGKEANLIVNVRFWLHNFLKSDINKNQFDLISGVDCSQPEEVENGRVFLVNGTTVFASVAEYHCLPGFQRSGHFSRKCGADGRWAGPIPLCVGKFEI